MAETIPKVTIVGRPNVGKSTLFNRLARRRISIVAPVPGVTRDRVSAVIDFSGKYFLVEDTAGAFLSRETDAQTISALNKADLAILVVDVMDGLIPEDEEMARLVRASGRPSILVVNKADNYRLLEDSVDFHNLGIAPVVVCSAKNGIGVSDITAAIAERIPLSSCPPAHEIKVAIVGARNAGKSTLFNRIVGEDRVVVSDIPGTTRDSVDVTLEYNGKVYTFIDTAGILRRSRIREGVEFYSVVRSRESIQRSDICLLILDCTREIGTVQKQLASFILKCGKPCILIFNKWDLAEERGRTADFHEYALKKLPIFSSCPMCFASALTGFNVTETLNLIPELYDRNRTQIPTPQINKTLRKISENTQPPAKDGKRFKVYYATQTAIEPPTFTLFVNDPGLVTPRYRKFLTHTVSEAWDLEEVPVRLRFRGRR